MPQAPPPQQGTQPTRPSHPETTPPHSTLNSRASWLTPRQGLGSRLLHGIQYDTDIGCMGPREPTDPPNISCLANSAHISLLRLSPPLSCTHTHTGTPSHTHVHVRTCTHASTNGYSLSHTCTCTTHASTYDCFPMYLHVHAHKRHFLSEACTCTHIHSQPMGILCPTYTCVYVIDKRRPTAACTTTHGCRSRKAYRAAIQYSCICMQRSADIRLLLAAAPGPHCIGFCLVRAGLNLQCSCRHMASGPALHSRASLASVHSRASDPVLHNTAPAVVGLAV